MRYYIFVLYTLTFLKKYYTNVKKKVTKNTGKFFLKNLILHQNSFPDKFHQIASKDKLGFIT